MELAPLKTGLGLDTVTREKVTKGFQEGFPYKPRVLWSLDVAGWNLCSHLSVMAARTVARADTAEGKHTVAGPSMKTLNPGKELFPASVSADNKTSSLITSYVLQPNAFSTDTPRMPL